MPWRGIGALGWDYYYIGHWIYFEGNQLPRTKKEPLPDVASSNPWAVESIPEAMDGRNSQTSSRGFLSDLPEGHYHDNHFRCNSKKRLLEENASTSSWTILIFIVLLDGGMLHKIGGRFLVKRRRPGKINTCCRENRIGEGNNALGSHDGVMHGWPKLLRRAPCFSVVRFPEC
jgi:hypothetical protein